MKQLLTILFLTNSLFVFAQNVQRSSLGMSGASNELVSNNTAYYISQSVGQNSLIGTFANQETTIRQGFQQPFIASKIIVSELDANIFPNPTEGSINIVLSDSRESTLFLLLYDSFGRLLSNKSIDYKTSYKMDMYSLSSGVYILKLSNGNKNFVAQIIKQ